MSSNHDQSSGGPGTARPPAGLGKAGRRLWRSLIDRFEFDPHELIMVEAAARQADMIAGLEAAIKDDGLTVAGSARQVRVHPAVAEARQSRLALSKLLADLRVPVEDETTAEKRTSQAARRAAQARWAKPRNQRAS